MKRKPLVALAHAALRDVNKKRVLKLLDSVNLTTNEKEIVLRTEINGERLKTMEDVFGLTADGVMKLKRNAMLRIGNYLLKPQ
jgi:hypothetical protein